MTDTLLERDALVDRAFRLWAPRMLLGGVDLDDISTSEARLEHWSDWIDEWCAHGDRHSAVAAEFEANGSSISAANAYRRAAAAYHFSKFVWVDDESKNASATARAVAATNSALRIEDPSARRIEAGEGDVRIAANLRVPRGAEGPVPLVVLIPGLDSTKEEFPSWERVFLARGVATLAVDGPGQGEVFHAGTRIWPAYEETLALALDAVADDGRLDHRRIGAAGTSLGGHYVVRGAVFEPRIRALVSVSAPPSPAATSGNAHSIAAVRFYTRSATDLEYADRAGAIDLAGVVEKLQQPALFATGDRDAIVPWEQTQSIAEEAQAGEFMLYEGGNHGLTNKAAEFRDRSADWLLSRLE